MWWRPGLNASHAQGGKLRHRRLRGLAGGCKERRVATALQVNTMPVVAADAFVGGVGVTGIFTVGHGMHLYSTLPPVNVVTVGKQAMQEHGRQTCEQADYMEATVHIFYCANVDKKLKTHNKKTRLSKGETRFFDDRTYQRA